MTRPHRTHNVGGRPTRVRRRLPLLWLLPALVCFLPTGCRRQTTQLPHHAAIQNKGSDTIVNLAQAWAEAYHKVAPNVKIEVSGGGSGVGVAALIKGAVDIANSSRDLKPSEIEQAKKNTGKDPKEFTVGYDGLAIYVHKDNPIEEITEEQLAEIFAEGGKITKWSELGVQLKK